MVCTVVACHERVEQVEIGAAGGGRRLGVRAFGCGAAARATRQQRAKQHPAWVQAPPPYRLRPGCHSTTSCPIAWCFVWFCFCGVWCFVFWCGFVCVRHGFFFVVFC